MIIINVHVYGFLHFFYAKTVICACVLENQSVDCKMWAKIFRSRWFTQSTYQSHMKPHHSSEDHSIIIKYSILAES